MFVYKTDENIIDTGIEASKCCLHDVYLTSWFDVINSL